MSISTVLKSESTAWLLGAIVVVGSSAVAYIQVGWLGIGIIGLIGLVISINISLHGDQAMSASGGHGSGDVPMIARQLEESRRSQSSPEQKKAVAAARAKRSKTLYVTKLIFLGMALSGFWLFSRFQF
jgi:hypothetical protein